MVRPVTADPRAEYVDWEIIDLSELPPVEVWTDEDWEDAILGTIATHSRMRSEAGIDGPGMELGEFLQSRGFKLGR